MRSSTGTRATALAAALLLAGCIEVPAGLLHSDRFAPSAGECLYPGLNDFRALPARFSLLSWNIYKQQGDWQAELARWAEETELLLLQEASGEPALYQWLAERDLHWFQVAAFSWRERPNGVLTAAPGDVTQVCAQRVAEPATRVPKSLLFSRYPLEGAAEQLLVVNLHAVNFSLRGRTYQAQLDRIGKEVAEHGGPVIVAGDFNRWNARRNRMLNDWARAQGLTEAVPEPDVRTRFLGYALDGIFYRGLELEWVDSARSEASDHGPLRAGFRMPGH